MGCGASKPAKISASEPQKSPSTGTEKTPSKVETAKTSAKDIEGIITINDKEIDLSKLSMIDIVSNAQLLYDIVVFLIKSNLARNQFMKAILRRIQSLEPCFAELQKKNSQLTKQPIINLIHIINRIKTVCEKMMAENKSFWERIKDVVTANAQLEELSDLSEMLTRTQADLNIPLHLEEAKKIDEMFTYLKGMNEQGFKTFQSVENQPTVLPLAKKKLKNEEAFIFWFECFPNFYLVEVDDFKRTFKDYIEEKTGKQIKPVGLERIVALIKEEDDPTAAKIDAGQVNRFFESLPLDVPWENIESVEKEIKELKNKKAAEAEQMRKKEGELLEEKVKKIENECTEEEKKLLDNKKYLRFLVTEAWLRQQKKKQDLNFRNIFVEIATGKIKGFGTSGKEQFEMTGTAEEDGSLALQLSFKTGERIQLNGKVKIDETIISFECKSGSTKLEIYLDLEYWFGYYEQYGDPHDMQLFFKIVGSHASGISLDDVGLALWRGDIVGKDFNMTKQYVKQHEVKYQGKIQHKKASTEIKGKWTIEDFSDNFYISYSATDDSSDDEGDESEGDVQANIEHCANNHSLKWAIGTSYTGDAYCNNCDRSIDITYGRWHCAECNYDVCPCCKRIPESETKTCRKSHNLQWDTTQGTYASPSYVCDICRYHGKTTKGRWCCKACEYDVCASCRKPPFA